MGVELNRIYQGDCVAGMSGLAEGSVDLAFADPPFNIGYKYDVYEDRRAAEEYLKWTRAWGAELVRALKPNGTFWLAIGDDFAAELKMIFQRELGLTCRSWVIWYYTFGVNCTHKFSRSHTHLFHFVKNPKSFTFNTEEIRVPSARQTVYADNRADSAGGCRTIRGFCGHRMQWRVLIQMRMCGIFRVCAGRSRSGRGSTGARCRSSCWRGSFGRRQMWGRWCWSRSVGAGRR